MVDVSRTFTVRQPREVIVAYLRDFSHAEQWDPGTVECTQEDDAPIALGTRWHNKSKPVSYTHLTLPTIYSV